MKRLLPKSINNPSGFTLVELMVVITIIAILSIIGIALFSNVQKSARDTKRKGDLDAIAKALETQYNSATASYPTTMQATWFASGQIPAESQTGSSAYNSTLNSSSFVVCASLENSTGNSSSRTSLTAQANGPYYCVRNQQ